MSDNTAIERNLNGSEAIAEAIYQEMDRDENILLLGEDVGKCGGVFGSSRNCLDKFGKDRVRDMPISEMTFTGMGVGLSMSGFRPIIEIMFADFLGVCLEQIYNAIGKIHYMSGGNVKMPVVIKTAAGNIGSAAQHSQCLWATLAHLPGLKIVAPASLHDHKGLMASSIRSDDPVVVFEHKELLLKRAKSFISNPFVPKNKYTVPIGKAIKLSSGSDITLVTLSYTVELALGAAKELEKEGIGIEVIEPEGTFYVWFKNPNGLKSSEFANLLLEKAGIVMTPGTGFGIYGEGYTRASVTLNDKQLLEAVSRIEKLTI